MTGVLELRQVSKTYRDGADEVHALREVDLSVEAGKMVAVMGPSGSGKSTLLTIAGDLKDRFALVAPGQAAPPDRVIALVRSGTTDLGGRTPAGRGLGRGPRRRVRTTAASWCSSWARSACSSSGCSRWPGSP